MTREARPERRSEPRQQPHRDRGTLVEVPGTVVVAVVDVSRHGLCCRVRGPVPPGRRCALRVPGPQGTTRVNAEVVRCVVSRLTSDGVEYEAAWRLSEEWLGAR